MRPTPITRIAALAATLPLADCAQNPVTGKPNLVFLSESQEIALGQRENANVRKQYSVYDDAPLQQYVSRIGQRLAKWTESGLFSAKPPFPIHHSLITHLA